jgi:hypothetical protein
MTTKIVHAFDSETRFYKGPITLNDGDLSPLEPGKHVLPGHCLEQSPPPAPEGMRVVAGDGGWALEAIPAAPVPTLKEHKARLLAQAAARRWKTETAGIALPGGVSVRTGADHRARIDQTIADMEAEGDTSVEFKAASGWITLTLQEIKDLRRALSRHARACFLAERDHHQTITALSTVAAAQSYDLSSGWPSPSVVPLPEA